MFEADIPISGLLPACPKCRGIGKIEEQTCPTCKGTGVTARKIVAMRV